MNQPTSLTKLNVFVRDKGSCALTGSKDLESAPHHCFFRSEYFEDDRHEAWNLITISKDAHYKIHHGVKGGKELEYQAKKLAIDRYKGKYIIKLEKIIKRKCL